MLVALYRVAPGLERDPATQEQVARCLSLCREGVALERFLGSKPRSGPPNYAVRVPRSSWEAVAQGEQTAVEERQRLGIGNAPIADVSELIASQGIWAPRALGSPTRCRGCSCATPASDSPFSSIHPTREGASASRMRTSTPTRCSTATCNIAVSSTGNSSELVERRANAFAAAVLMPRNGVYEALRRLDKGLPSRQEQTIFDVASGGRIDAEFRSPARSQRVNYKDIAMLAHRFGVGYQAALYRLKSLRHLSPAESRELLEQETFGRQLLRELSMVGDAEEPEHRDRELRSEITHLAIEAYRREEISRGRVLELSKMLGMKGDVLLRLAEAARGE